MREIQMHNGSIESFPEGITAMREAAENDYKIKLKIYFYSDDGIGGALDLEDETLLRAKDDLLDYAAMGVIKSLAYHNYCEDRTAKADHLDYFLRFLNSFRDIKIECSYEHGYEEDLSLTMEDARKIVGAIQSATFQIHSFIKKTKNRF